MVSGYDKYPPPDGYEPDIGIGGWILLLAIVALLTVGSPAGSS